MYIFLSVLTGMPCDQSELLLQLTLEIASVQMAFLPNCYIFVLQTFPHLQNIEIRVLLFFLPKFAFLEGQKLPPKPAPKKY